MTEVTSLSPPMINVLYEDSKMVSVVTGGIKGTEEKPEELRFEGPQEIPSKKEDPGPEPKETTREKPAAAKADKTKAKEKTGHKITAGDEVFTFEISLTNEYGQPLDDVNIITDN